MISRSRMMRESEKKLPIEKRRQIQLRGRIWKLYEVTPVSSAGAAPRPASLVDTLLHGRRLMALTVEVCLRLAA